MFRFFSILNRFYMDLCKGLNYLAVGAAFFMSLWIFADVIGRYFFNHPIGGTTELVQVMIIIIVFLGIPYTWQQGRHIRTTMILERLSPKKRIGLEIFIRVIAIAVFTFICVFGWNAAWDSWSIREFVGEELRVPVYPSRFIVVIGAGLLVIQLILDSINYLKALTERPE